MDLIKLLAYMNLYKEKRKSKKKEKETRERTVSFFGHNKKTKFGIDTLFVFLVS